MKKNFLIPNQIIKVDNNSVLIKFIEFINKIINEHEWGWLKQYLNNDIFGLWFSFQIHQNTRRNLSTAQWYSL